MKKQFLKRVKNFKSASGRDGSTRQSRSLVKKAAENLAACAVFSPLPPFQGEVPASDAPQVRKGKTFHTAGKQCELSKDSMNCYPRRGALLLWQNKERTQ